MKAQAVGRTRPRTDRAESRLVEQNVQAARKHGVRIKTWQRGVRTGKAILTFEVYVDGQRVRAISGRFATVAAARKAVLAAGLKLAS